ncbi:MAG: ATP-binding protein, partial [Candidatus Moranbacteria bacterium]|nr:ATP-binding protein [Candidatus Moranbacteria bacterium]
MKIEILNTPSASILMNSLRSIGYSFEASIADIIDNSISANAKNINIDFPPNDKNIYISIFDDGIGMSYT